jgi:hypothetical protein
MRSRRLAGLCMLALMPLVFYQAYRYVSRPELYEGDVLAARSCRHCAGTGTSGDLPGGAPGRPPKCPFCRGKGEVQVILPGPNRPTRIWGGVVARDQVGREWLESSAWAASRGVRALGVQGLLAPGTSELPGSIGNALVVIEDAQGATTVITADGSGRFSRRLPPGRYTISAEVEGHRAASVRLEIPEHREPIWLEHARLDEEPFPGRASGEITLLFVLGKRRQGGSFVRVHGG